MSVSSPGSAAEPCSTRRVATPRSARFCKVAGIVIARHSALRDAVWHALKCILTGVWWERVVPDIVRDDGEEARLDIVVEDPCAGALLDFVVFFPIRPNGKARYKHRGHVQRKHTDYPMTKL